MARATDIHPDRRTRLRRETMRELKAAAWDEVRERGPVALSLRSVARRVGLSAAGLYRYVASREELLTLLIADGYHDFADHLLIAGGGHPAGLRPTASPVTDRPVPKPPDHASAEAAVAVRSRAVVLTYRRWAVEHPREFALLFGDPIPGYAAPADGPTTRGMRRLGSAFAQPFLDAWRAGLVRVPAALAAADLAGTLAPMAGEELELGGHEIPYQVHALLLTVWGRVHGQVALESFGHHDWLFPQGCAPLFHAEVEVLLTQLGLAGPQEG